MNVGGWEGNLRALLPAFWGRGRNAQVGTVDANTSSAWPGLAWEVAGQRGEAVAVLAVSGLAGVGAWGLAVAGPVGMVEEVAGTPAVWREVCLMRCLLGCRKPSRSGVGGGS